MARGRFVPPARALDLVDQHARIKQAFRGFDWTWKAGVATWTGTLRPREHSGRYQVRITYNLRTIPKVFVTSASLDRACRHLYPDGSLCLYWPEEWHWTRDESIAATLLPWAADWLYFYELWLDTGKWLGPSSHDESAGISEPNIA